MPYVMQVFFCYKFSSISKYTLPLTSTTILSLRLPHPLDRLRDANVVGLKLVQADADLDGGDVERPPEHLAELRPALLGDVVDDDLLEAHVGVQQEGAAEDGVGGGVQGAGGEGGDGEGDDARGEEALRCPVVGALCRVGFGDGGWVVD